MALAPDPQPIGSPLPRSRAWWAERTPLPTVRSVGLVVVVAAVTAVVPIWRPVATLGLVVAVLLLADFARTPAPHRVGVARQLPPVLGLDSDELVRWYVRNPVARALVVGVSDSLAPSAGASSRRATVTVPPLGRAHAQAWLRPSRRGVLAPDEIAVRVQGPLGLVSRQASRSLPGRAEVHPSFRSRAAAELRLTRGRLLDAGLRSTRSRGGGGDFDQLRDYGPDDDFRRLDWAATARAGRPIVRTYRAERNQTVLVLLDTGRLMAGMVRLPAEDTRPGGLSQVPRLDHTMDATLALTTVAGRLGDRVGLLAFGSDVRAVLPPAGGSGQLAAMSRALFRLEPELAESAYATAFHAAVARFPRRSLLVVATELAAEALTDTLVPSLPLLLRDHLVIVASIRDPQLSQWRLAPVERPGEAYRAAAASAALRERRRTAAHLRRLGAVVVDDEPARLPGELVDSYLGLKSTLRL